MSTNLRRGWCPGALRPMEAKDGLLVRLRVTNGILSAATARSIADLAARHGNGLFDLSTRGNLQMRGVGNATLSALHDGLQTLGLLDASLAAESVRNAIASPLAGLHDGLDIRPLVTALEQRLSEDRALHALPGKFGFLIDDGSRPSLAGIAADVRFDWDGERFSLGVAGTADEAEHLEFCNAGELVDRAVAIARSFLALAARRPFGCRMRDVVLDLGVETMPQTFDASPSCAKRDRTSARTIVGLRNVQDTPYLGLAAPFGRLDAAMLRAAADLAEKTPHHELRLTPWRVILVPGVVVAQPLHGFITDPNDPRLGVAACIGAAGCMRGTTDTRADAAVLAGLLPPGDDIALHVSGCEKGCAKASAAPMTLVARVGRYDLVRDGRAGDTPVLRGLDLAEIQRMLSTTLEPA